MKIFDVVLSWFNREEAYITYWFNINEKVRFVFIEIVSMSLRYLIFVILGILFSSLHYQLILALMWILSSFIAFILYKKLVFRTEGNHLKEFGKSVITWTISYIINVFILYLLVDKLHQNVYLGQAIAITTIVIINYILFKYFAFKQKELTFWEKLLGIFNDLGK